MYLIWVHTHSGGWKTHSHPLFPSSLHCELAPLLCAHLCPFLLMAMELHGRHHLPHPQVAVMILLQWSMALIFSGPQKDPSFAPAPELLDDQRNCLFDPRAPFPTTAPMHLAKPTSWASSSSHSTDTCVT